MPELRDRFYVNMDAQTGDIVSEYHDQVEVGPGGRVSFYRKGDLQQRGVIQGRSTLSREDALREARRYWAELRRRYACTFPDFDDAIMYLIDADAPHEAAELAAAWWERYLEDFRGRQGEETLRIRVEGGKDVSWWEVLGEEGMYIAKAMTQRED